METIVFSASKGGVGKTTLAAALSVEAAKEGNTLIVDLDPQGSLSAWWNKREADMPELVEATIANLPQVMSEAEAAGFKYLLVDTPPAHLVTISKAIELASFVLIPCQPSPIDIEAIGDTLELIEQHHKPFAFVMNRLITRTKIGEQAVLLLANHGKIAGIPIIQRTVYATAMVDGRTAPEIDGGKQASAEIQALWKYVKQQIKGKRKDYGR